MLLARVGRVLRRVGQDITWGAQRGLLIGAAFSIFGLIMRAIRGPQLLEAYGIGLGALLLAYLGGGTGAGAIAGLGRPLLKWRAGAMAVGVVGGIFAFGALVLGIKGPVSNWAGIDTFAVIFLGIVGGAWMGNALWEEFIEPTLPRPSLPPGPPPPRPPLGLWHP